MESQTEKNKILEHVEASYGMIPLKVEKNVALRKQNSKKLDKKVSLKTGNFYALRRYSSTKVERRTWLYDQSGTSGPPAIKLTK